MLVLGQAGVVQLAWLHFSIRSGAAIRSSLALLCGALVVVLLDLVRLVETGLYALDGLYVLELHLVLALLCLPLIQLSYFAARIVAALLSRFESASGFYAGIACFFLLQPPAAWLGAFLDPGLHWAVAPAATLLAGLLISVPLIALIPDLRGENAPLILIASLVAWSCVDIPSIVSRVPAQFVLTVSIFLWLQIRRRLHRSPAYAAFRVSRFSRLFVAGLAAFVGAVTLLDSHPEWSVSLVLLVSWLFMSAFLPGEPSRRPGAAMQIVVLAYLAGFALVLHLLRFSNEAPVVSTRLLSNSSVAGRIILNAGVLLDRDYDGNSSWPGADPDDNDPCIRRDGYNRCRRTVRFEPDPATDKLLLVTQFSVMRSAGEQTIFAPSDDPAEALVSIIRAVDGAGALAPTGEPALARIAEAGYRTVCAFASDRKYPAVVTHGCQVFLNAESFESALAAVKKYEEKKTFVWIHSDERDALPEVSLKGYTKASLVLDLRRQSGNYSGPQSPSITAAVLPALLGQESALSEEEAVDIRHLDRAPAALKWKGLDGRRFTAVIRYRRRPGDGQLERRTSEGYAGALRVSGPLDIP